MAKYKKGVSGNPKGRKPGAENNITKQMKTVKQTVMEAFDELQKDKVSNIVAWGKKNPAAFYNIAAKLIPTEITANIKKFGKDFEEEVYE